MKKEFPRLTIVSSDISAEALALAKKNAASNQVDIILRQGDLLVPYKGEKAHYCVVNPPYVSRSEYEDLDPSVAAFEPQLALIGGEDGLDFYRRLALELPMYLTKKGKVWLEMGYLQGKAVFDLFYSPFWKKKEIKKDWSGKNRFFFLETE